MNKKSSPFLYSAHTLKFGQDFLDILYSVMYRIKDEKVSLEYISSLALVSPEILLVGELLELSRRTHLLPPDQPNSFQADPAPGLCTISIETAHHLIVD